MPEKIVDLQQKRAIVDWIKGQKGEWRGSFRGISNYVVGGEPLIMASTTESSGDVKPAEPSLDGDFRLSCSKNHAKMLEAARIVEFSKKGQQSVAVPVAVPVGVVGL